MRRLEIGGDPHPLEGFEQLPEEDLWGWGPLPFKSRTIVEVYASHVLEHVPWNLVPFAMSEAFRVLVPGGFLEIHTVNLAYLADCYRKGIAGDQWEARGENPGLHPLRWFCSRLYSIDTKPGGRNWHLATFDRPYLMELFTGAGFVNLESVKEPRGREKHGPINLGMRGWRP